MTHPVALVGAIIVGRLVQRTTSDGRRGSPTDRGSSHRLQTTQTLHAGQRSEWGPVEGSVSYLLRTVSLGVVPTWRRPARTVTDRAHDATYSTKELLWNSH